MGNIISGKVYQLSPLLRRITAPNPSPLTGAGTNTYLIGNHTVIDPGPAIDSHIEAILLATKNKINNIFVTHTHSDHSPAASVLAKETGAVLIGCTQVDDGYQDASFTVNQQLEDRQVFAIDNFEIEAIHTPGHVGNHFCYFLKEDGILLSGDHIMEGSTVVIIPPAGDMSDYMDSLRLLGRYAIKSIAPGHGELIKNPMDWVNYLIEHRLGREQKIVHALEKVGETSLGALTKIVYDDVDPAIHDFASLSLWAHLLKLKKEGRAQQTHEDEKINMTRWLLSQ